MQAILNKRNAMKREIVAAMVLVFSFSGISTAQDAMIGVEKSEVLPMLETEPDKQEAPKKVTAVYGVSADDYLPQNTPKRYHYRPKLRGAKSRPAFDLPDLAYLIGGIILLSILMGTLVSFIKEFEYIRKEEAKEAEREQSNPE